MSTNVNNATVIPLHANKSRIAHNSHADTIMRATIQNSLTKLPKTLKQVHTITNTRFKASIQCLFDHVDDALFELADRATSNLEQNVFFESMRELRIQRRHMETSFIKRIDQNFATLVGDNIEPDQPTGLTFGEVDFDADTDDLSLVDKDELEELVAIDSLVSKSLAKNKNALRGVSLRIGLLLSSPILEKHNPFSPRLLANGFIEASSKVHIDIKAKLVLFKLFERYVMNDLASILNEVNQFMTEQGVPAPNSRRHRSDDNKHTTRHSTPASDTQRVSSSTRQSILPNTDTNNGLYATLQSLLKPKEVQENYSYDTDQPDFSHDELSHDQHPTDNISSRLLAALSQLQQQQLQQASIETNVCEGAIHLLTSQHIQSAIQSSTGEQNVNEHSQDVIKLVDMLFSYILEDGNLPDPVKLLLSRLQIPFIKVAIVDEAFFNKEGHPARRLLNEMATASIGWTGDINRDKPDVLLTKIESIVTKVLEKFDDNFDIFTLLLTDFIAFQEKEKRRFILFEKRAIDAEDGKAKAEIGREKVHEKINELMMDKQLPDTFILFLQGPWSNILFLIYIRQGELSKQWGNALSIARELIWTTFPIENDAHKKKLIRLLPRLQMLIQKGLENISFNPSKQAQFFDKFNQHYETIINTYQSLPHQSLIKFEGPNENLDDTIIDESENKIDASNTEQPKISIDVKDENEDKNTHTSNENNDPSKAEMNHLHTQHQQSSDHESIRTSQDMDLKSETVEVQTEVSTEQKALLIEKTAPSHNENIEIENNIKAENNDIVIDTQYLNLVDNFTVGVWFEKVTQDSTPYRCRLAAIIRGTGKYIFVNRAGIKVAEETRSSLALQLQTRHLRTLDDGMLFDRALESVISSLRRKP